MFNEPYAWATLLRLSNDKDIWSIGHHGNKLSLSNSYGKQKNSPEANLNLQKPELALSARWGGDNRESTSIVYRNVKHPQKKLSHDWALCQSVVRVVLVICMSRDGKPCCCLWNASQAWRVGVVCGYGISGTPDCVSARLGSFRSI